MRSSMIRGVLVCLISILVVISATNNAISSSCETWTARAVSVQGMVESQPAGESGWTVVSLNQTFCPGDTIRVGENGRAGLLLANQSVLRLNAGSRLTLQGLEGKTTTAVELKKGAAHFFSRIFKGLKVKTPFLTAGVRGTEFYIGVSEDRTEITIFEGGVLAANQAGELNLAGGQSAVAHQGQAPVLKVVARPRDAVQWTMYVPPVLYRPSSAGEIPPDTDDPRLLVQRASQQIATGQVDAASRDLARALQIAPGNGDALALQAVIAVARNEKKQALKLADQAAAAAPNAATPRIARSYAHQAGFELEKARDDLTKATELEPENALAWARLAEMHMSFGDLKRALAAAEKAAALEPGLARTQTVLGFARLTQVKTAMAKEAFDKAIAIDQADPLPRLGLGLATIRDGKLSAGREQIEIAASLDPNNSLVRSYLGKAFYEEKRNGLDEREFKTAKELDPNDPTPWFYDAIAKQTTNRPVEALQNMEKAIELNDNRAVYRSKLQLDSDLAARSSGLARIYNDLGFERLGLVEGWKSVNTDPTNHSAHRFLSDSYSAVPRHKIARVSELLQSQLLQPTNITPIQPLLAESNQYLISSQGSSAAGFNTYNPMFNRNQAMALLSGVAGNDETWGGEGVVAGIYDKLSLSAGYTHFDTEGWRPNAFQEDKIGNIFAQYEICHKTSVQAEYRRRETKWGDVSLNFFESNDFPNLEQEEETDTYRLGLRHSFSPNATIIGNVSHQNMENKFFDVIDLDPAVTLIPPPPVQDFATSIGDQDSFSAELQQLFRSNRFNLVLGAGYFKIDQEFDQTEDFYWPGMDPPFFLGSSPSQFEFDINHVNAYLYSHLNFFKDVSFTLGASGDFFDREDRIDNNDIEEDQFNPKFGVTWTPCPGTTLRGAAFRTLRRTLITNQTLEPTQVAGFNQFFDDIDATRAWVSGAAVDQKFPKNIYAGAEYYHRDLDVPIYQITSGVIQLNEYSWEENIARAYLNWAPHAWLAFSAEYAYEKFDFAEGYNLGAREVETHSVPLGVNFFHPIGLSCGIKATYWDQEGEFRNLDQFTVSPGDDTFWLVDAAIRYRFPKRFGFIAVGVNNLFDQEFEYFEVEQGNSRIQPSTSFFASLTIALP